MDAHVIARDGFLVTGYEPIIETLALPDPNDRHVLAAAIVDRADLIVTKNLQDFRTERLALFGIEAQHPDIFVRNLLALDEAAALAAVQQPLTPNCACYRQSHTGRRPVCDKLMGPLKRACRP
jgi:hypothetical protein